jgi:hypothetical protein
MICTKQTPNVQRSTLNAQRRGALFFFLVRNPLGVILSKAEDLT